MDKNIWFNPNKVLSYNAFLNFIVGERGVGKSYGFKKYLVKHFLKTGKQFVYVRRFKTELKEAMYKDKEPRFFNQIKNDEELKDIKLSNTKDTMFINKKIAGFAIPLSIANISKSSTYDNVDTIVFDEFIIDKGNYHYLQDEVVKFMELIETIGRLRDIKVFFLGNAISSTNPYFMFFNIDLPYNSDIKICKRDKNGNPLVLIHYIKNLKYREIKKQTRFGQLIEGTLYGKYAIDNEFLRDSKAFIKKRDNKARFFFTLVLDNNTYGVWCNYKDNIIYISKDYDPNFKIRFTLNNDSHDEKTLLVKVRSSLWFGSLIEHYRLGLLCFDNIKIKNTVMKYLVKYINY